MKALFLSAILPLSGCGTIDNLIKGPRVYGGVKADLYYVHHGDIGSAISIFDLPFSAILDTALLPVTLWFEIFREEESKRPERWSPLEEKAKP